MNNEITISIKPGVGKVWPAGRTPELYDLILI